MSDLEPHDDASEDLPSHQPLRTPTFRSDDSGATRSESPGVPEVWHGNLRRVGGYELLGTLGHGGMGVVYKARQPGLNRVVALKMMRGGPHADPDAASRFRREVEAVARLQHPNIVQVYEVGEADGHPYLAMEFVTGGGLDKALKKAPLPARTAAGLLEALARAADYAHRRGVVHRDLKPANVLLQPNPASEQTVSDAPGPMPAADDVDLTAFSPKIADFGLAKLAAEEASPTLSGALLGTPSYMAPEQASGGAKHVGPAADVWSLGAILYQCLTGRPPFQGETTLDTLWLIGDQDPVLPSALNPRVPRDLETVCLKCLEKTPAQRYETALDLAEDLGRFLRDEPIRARPPTASDQLRKFARRHRAALAGVAAVFLALVLGLIGTGVGMMKARDERDRARQARQRTEELLAESYAQTARLALQRGAWRAALASLDQALEAGHPDQALLRLQKVRAWCGLHDIPKAVQELEALAQRTDLGGLEGSVLLWRADIALGRAADDDASLELVRQALQRQLSPPEAEYARGLLADTSSKAVEHFRRAVDADPFHQRANGMLGLTLLMLGRVPEARERLTFARLLFPEDPNFAVLLAMAHAWEGDMTAAHVELGRAQGQLGERLLQNATKLLKLMQLLRGLEATLNGEPDRVPIALATQLLPAMAAAGADVRALKQAPEGVGAGLLLPIPPVLVKAMRRPLAVLPLAWLGGPGRAIEELERSFQMHPDAFLAFVRGLLALDAQRLPEAERAFRDAVEAFSLVPVRRVALVALVTCQWDLAVQEPANRREWLGRAVQNARKLLNGGGLAPWQLALIASLGIETDEIDLARQAIREWQRQEPEALLLWRKRLAVEFKSQAYGPAIAAADKVLQLRPGDAAAQKARADAIERLRRQAKSYPP